MPKKPVTLDELFVFYFDVVKPLYSAVQVTNVLPTEVLFEINAAFDHVSRMYTYQDPESEVVSRAYSHLKRSCLDIFKLSVKQATDEYKTLLTIDTGSVDNGDFDRELHKLYNSIREDAINARKNEGNTQKDDDDAIAAFDLWAPVYQKCVKFNKEFFLHSRLNWAKRRTMYKTARDIIIGALGSALCAFVLWYLGLFQSTSVPSKEAPAPIENKQGVK